MGQFDFAATLKPIWREWDVSISVCSYILVNYSGKEILKTSKCVSPLPTNRYQSVSVASWVSSTLDPVSQTLTDGLTGVTGTHHSNPVAFVSWEQLEKNSFLIMCTTLVMTSRDAVVCEIQHPPHTHTSFTSFTHNPHLSSHHNNVVLLRLLVQFVLACWRAAIAPSEDQNYLTKAFMEGWSQSNSNKISFSSSCFCLCWPLKTRENATKRQLLY